MTKKNWTVSELDNPYVNNGFSITCGIAHISPKDFPSYEEAEKFAKKRAGDNLKGTYGVYELVAVVEAPAPDVEVTKV